MANSYTGNVQFMRTSLTASTLTPGITPAVPSPAPVPAPAPVVSTKFATSDRGQVSSGPLNLRATASISGALVGTEVNGALGTIVAGPISQDGYNWWKINFDSGMS